tara:strand:+ start:103 stop:519 length:417 start_codon:yes stop_codon:yes gene_type:complete
MVHTNNNGGEDAFGSTFNKGYFMNINGYRISVQFGYGNYVDSDVRYGRQPKVTELANDEGCVLYDISQKFNVWQSNLAEVMIDTPQGIPDFGMDDGILNDQVMGHCSAECVAKLIGCISSVQPDQDIRQALAQIYNSN